jgi:hypothetical protein
MTATGFLIAFGIKWNKIEREATKLPPTEREETPDKIELQPR